MSGRKTEKSRKRSLSKSAVTSSPKRSRRSVIAREPSPAPVALPSLPNGRPFKFKTRQLQEWELAMERFKTMEAQGDFIRFSKGTFVAIDYAKGLLCSGSRDEVLRQSHRLQRDGTTLGPFIRGIGVPLRESHHSASKRWTAAMGTRWTPGRAPAGAASQPYRIFRHALDDRGYSYCDFIDTDGTSSRVKMLVDWGANDTVISESFADPASPRFINDAVESKGVGQDDWETLPSYRLKVRFGGLNSVVDATVQTNEAIIGVDILKRFNHRILYPSKSKGKRPNGISAGGRLQ